MKASLQPSDSAADVSAEAQLAKLGISMHDVSAQLLDDGVGLLGEAMDGLLRAIDRPDTVEKVRR